MYWVTVTMLGMAHYFFRQGRSSGSDTKKQARRVNGDAGTATRTSVMADADNRGADIPRIRDLEISLDTESDPGERHLIYSHIIETAYRNRRTNADDLQTAMELSQQYMAEFASLRDPVLKMMGDDPKIIPVFKMLAIMLEESGEYDQAIQVCKTALGYGIEDGTKTGFEGRIERILKKQADNSL